MTDNQFIYAVARIRSKELTLLDKPFFDQLLACKSYKECMRLLADRGWGVSGDEDADQLLVIEREKTWDLVRELVEDMSVFDTFLYGNDFHNLKAAMKQVYLNKEIPDIYITHGTIDPKVIYDAVKSHDFTLLPEYMRDCAEEAYQIQMRSGDSQLCDIIIDRAALDSIYQKGKKSGNDLLTDYVELKVVAANINIAVRGYHTGKNIEFFERAFADCSSLNRKNLIEVSLSGKKEIYDYLSTTAYADAVPALEESTSAFERWCDNRIIKLIQPQKYNSFTVSPLAAYILARENEIKSVRILLSGKRNFLPENSIRERLREMYV